MHRRVLAALLALGAAGCSDITYQAPTAWSADVLPVGPVGQAVDGNSAAASQGRRTTEVGISIDGQPGTTYSWRVNLGTCASPGPLLGGQGAYPDFTAEADGEGEVTRTFVSALMESGEDYHVTVLLGAEGTTIVGCGNYNELSF
jgi:hypothetical protein